MALQLLEANIHNKVSALDEVLRLLADIRSAWVDIDPSMQAQPQAEEAPPAAHQPLSYGRV